MMTLYLIQSAVPLILIGWLAFAPAQSVVGSLDSPQDDGRRGGRTDGCTLRVGHDGDHALDSVRCARRVTVDVLEYYSLTACETVWYSCSTRTRLMHQ